eukprot:SAG31_NODE_701_length_12730_cov_3.008709_3_plen_82_part_00
MAALMLCMQLLAQPLAAGAAAWQRGGHVRVTVDSSFGYSASLQPGGGTIVLSGGGIALRCGGGALFRTQIWDSRLSFMKIR